MKNDIRSKFIKCFSIVGLRLARNLKTLRLHVRPSKPPKLKH